MKRFLRGLGWSTVLLSFMLGTVTIGFANVISSSSNTTTAKNSANSNSNNNITVPPILDLTAINSTIDPCEDFYQYACGQWIARTTIPADKFAVYRQWSDLNDINDLKLNKILEDLYNSSLKTTLNSGNEKLAQFYHTCMQAEESKNLSNSLSLLQEKIATIKNIKNTTDLSQVIAKLQLIGVPAFFSYSSGQDTNNSEMVTAYLDQGGIALPNRDYYIKNDPKSLEILQKYREHIATMLLLSAVVSSAPEAETAAKEIVALETGLATNSLSLEDRRDPYRLNNPMDLEKVKKLAPLFDWDTFFKQIGTPQVKDFIVAVPAFYQYLNNFISKTENFHKFKLYLTWQLINKSAVAIGGKFEQENFIFWGKYLKGKKEIEPRWKVCTHLTGEALRDLLGYAFVATNSGELARKKTMQMIDTVKDVFQRELDLLDWIDTPTKKAAALKLNALKRKVGYPEKWKSYESVSIGTESSLSNLLAASTFTVNDNLSQIGKEVDKTKWEMPPWETNAYYEPSMNEFVFPLGELLPPVLDLNASEGVNYGALGATIGHELIHGYDDEGRHYDATGNLKEWWSKEVEKKFNEMAICYEQQANKYEVLPGLFIRGQATLGENLADQGGTKLAYLAYRSSVSASSNVSTNVNTNVNAASVRSTSYTPDQQFFISYAQSWCGKVTPEAIRVQVASDVHPTVDFRVNAVVMNMPEFAIAFSCRPGQKMAPIKRCSLW